MEKVRWQLEMYLFGFLNLKLFTTSFCYFVLFLGRIIATFMDSKMIYSGILIHLQFVRDWSHKNKYRPMKAWLRGQSNWFMSWNLTFVRIQYCSKHCKECYLWIMMYAIFPIFAMGYDVLISDTTAFSWKLIMVALDFICFFPFLLMADSFVLYSLFLTFLKI